ncbi:dehydrogenase/reductase SDR family member 7B-like [Rhopilema esculentum]|uniref:dehydrogenase/reductase SDR family member 7B-like n=1 Tax=Rhopilema esculentum TaxID=499914 RepID=UPI0031D7313C
MVNSMKELETSGTEKYTESFLLLEMLPLIVFVVPCFVLWWLKKTIFKPRKVFDVKDKVVLITGASSGLGKACAYRFAEAGAKLILSARNVEKLEEVKDSIIKRYSLDSALGPKVIPIDLSDCESITKAAELALMAYGHIDILINNAGISCRGSIVQTKMEVHRQLMNVNYFGPLLLTKSLLPSMIERKEGHIVGISTVQGKIAIPFRSPYTASKHAFDAFFTCLRSEVASSNINVTLISPGYIRTNLSINARTSDGTQYGSLDPTTAAGMEPGHVAEEILSAVECLQEDVVIADMKANLAILLKTLWPSLLSRVMKKRAQKEEQSELVVTKNKTD